MRNNIRIKLILSSVIIFWIPVQSICQDQKPEERKEFEVKFGKNLEDLGERMDKWGQEMEESVKTGEPLPAIPTMSNLLIQKNQPKKLGLYLDNLDFEEAYHRRYPENYGALVNRTIKGGNGERAGLVKGDIIMEFGGQKVLYEDHLTRLRDSKKLGDTVTIKYFRDENIMLTSLTFAPELPKVDQNGKQVEKKRRLSPGYGGGGPELVSIDFDFSAINNFLKLNGFNPINSNSLLTFGGGGMGNVGNGWFIGGMGAGYQNKQQIQILDNNGQLAGYRKYILGLGYGGVTITKKVPLFTKRVVLDASIMLGSGEITLDANQTDGKHSWGNSISTNDSYSVSFKKGFVAYRPSVGLLVRIKNWVGIHGSVGYFGTYSSSEDWTDSVFDFTVDPASGKSSPELPNNLSYSLGFWFGF